MPKTVKFEGKTYRFPDDVSTEEISAALGGRVTAPRTSGPTPSAVVASIPGNTAPTRRTPTAPQDNSLFGKFKDSVTGVLEPIAAGVEAQANILSGIPATMVGMPLNALDQAAAEAIKGEIGTSAGNRRIGEAQLQGMDALTYTPRTEMARGALEDLAPVFDALMGVAPVAEFIAGAGALPAARSLNVRRGTSELPRAVEGEYIPGRPMDPEGQIGTPVPRPDPPPQPSSGALPPAAAPEVRALLTQLREADVPVRTIERTVADAPTPVVAVENLKALLPEAETGALAAAAAPDAPVRPVASVVPEVAVQAADAPVEAPSPVLRDVSGRVPAEIMDVARETFPTAVTIENTPRAVRVFRALDADGKIVGGFKTNAAGEVIDMQARDAEGRMAPVEQAVPEDPYDRLDALEEALDRARLDTSPFGQRRAAKLDAELEAADNAEMAAWQRVSDERFYDEELGKIKSLVGDSKALSNLADRARQIDWDRVIRNRNRRKESKAVEDFYRIATESQWNVEQVLKNLDDAAQRMNQAKERADAGGIGDAALALRNARHTLELLEDYVGRSGRGNFRQSLADAVAFAEKHGGLNSNVKKMKRGKRAPRGKQAGALHVDEIADAVHNALLRLRMGNISQLGQAFAKQAWYRTISLIRDIDTPTARALADQFAPDRGAARGLMEAMEFEGGRWATKLDHTVERVRGRMGGVPERDSLAVMRGLRTGEPVPVRLQSVVDDLRTYLADMYRYESEVLDIGERPNYVPQVWDAEHIRKNLEPSIAFFAEMLDTTPDSAANVVRRILDSADHIYEPETHLGRYDGAEEWTTWANRQGSALGGASKPSFERGRRINIPPQMMLRAEEFLINDVEAVLSRYTQSAVRRVEYARRFGQNEEKLNRAVAKIIAEYTEQRQAMSAGDIARRAPPRSPELLARDIYNVADAAQGKFTYFPVARQQFPGAIRVARAVMAFEVMTKMGVVALASLPEFFAAAMQHGWRPAAYLRGVQYAATEAVRSMDKLLTGKHHLPQMEAVQFLERLGLIYNSTLRSKQMERFGATSTKWASRFMQGTRLEALTNIQRIVAADSLSRMMSSYAKRLTNPKASPASKDYAARILDELGFPPHEAAQWHAAGQPAKSRWSQYIDTVILRGVNQDIVTPNAMSKSLAYNDPFLQLPLLFTSFTNVMTNTFLKRFARELGNSTTPLSRKAGAIGGLIAAVATAYFVQWFKAQNLYQDSAQERYENSSTEKKIWLALESSYMPAPVSTLSRVLATKTDRYGNTRAGLPSDRMAILGQEVFGAAGSDAALILNAAVSGDHEVRAKAAAQLTPVLTILPAVEDWEAEQLIELQEELELDQ